MVSEEEELNADEQKKLIVHLVDLYYVNNSAALNASYIIY